MTWIRYYPTKEVKNFEKKKKNFFSSESTFVAGQFVSVVKPPLTH